MTIERPCYFCHNHIQSGHSCQTCSTEDFVVFLGRHQTSVEFRSTYAGYAFVLDFLRNCTELLDDNDFSNLNQVLFEIDGFPINQSNSMSYIDRILKLKAFR